MTIQIIENQRFTRYFSSFILFFTVVIYWFRFGYENKLIRGSFFSVTIFFTMLAGIYHLGKYGLKKPRSVSLLLYILALSFLFFGNVISIDDLIIPAILRPTPFFHDLIILIAYPLFLIGVIKELFIEKIKVSKTNQILLLLSTCILLVFAFFVIYYGINYVYTGAGFQENIIFALYGVSDLIMLLMILVLAVLISTNMNGKDAPSWSFMLVGFLLFLMADIFWSLFSQEYASEVWLQRSIMDTFWIFGHICFALSFLNHNIHNNPDRGVLLQDK